MKNRRVYWSNINYLYQTAQIICSERLWKWFAFLKHRIFVSLWISVIHSFDYILRHAIIHKQNKPLKTVQLKAASSTPQRFQEQNRRRNNVETGSAGKQNKITNWEMPHILGRILSPISSCGDYAVLLQQKRRNNQVNNRM